MSEASAATVVTQVSPEKVAGLPGLGFSLRAVTAHGEKSHFDIRMLSARSRRQEDPITGSLNELLENGAWRGAD